MAKFFFCFLLNGMGNPSVNANSPGLCSSRYHPMFFWADSQQKPSRESPFRLFTPLAAKS